MFLDAAVCEVQTESYAIVPGEAGPASGIDAALGRNSVGASSRRRFCISPHGKAGGNRFTGFR